MAFLEFESTQTIRTQCRYNDGKRSEGQQKILSDELSKTPISDKMRCPFLVAAAPFGLIIRVFGSFV